MIIYIDGPEKAGKTTLVNSILRGFDEKRSQLVKCSGRDIYNGLGYLRPFLNGLDSFDIFVWDRGWTSEVVYGDLLNQDRNFAKNPFLAEWFYSRLLNCRGGRFILLPDDETKLKPLRDDTDLPVSPIVEFKSFNDHGVSYGYHILENDYKRNSLWKNTKICRGSAFVGVHKIHSTKYVGPLNPTYTFVGDVDNEFPLTQRPFLTTNCGKYFEQFGKDAIVNFGYATIDGFLSSRRKYPKLFNKVITVGNRANHLFPVLPNARFNPTTPTYGNVKMFGNDVRRFIAREFNK